MPESRRKKGELGLFLVKNVGKDELELGSLWGVTDKGFKEFFSIF